MIILGSAPGLVAAFRFADSTLLSFWVDETRLLQNLGYGGKRKLPLHQDHLDAQGYRFLIQPRSLHRN